MHQGMVQLCREPGITFGGNVFGVMLYVSQCAVSPVSPARCMSFCKVK